MMVTLFEYLACFHRLDVFLSDNKKKPDVEQFTKKVVGGEEKKKPFLVFLAHLSQKKESASHPHHPPYEVEDQLLEEGMERYYEKRNRGLERDDTQDSS